MTPISPVSPVSPVTMTAAPTSTPGTAASARGFGELVDAALNNFQAQQVQAQNVLAQAMAGNGSVTGAMVAVSESQSALDVATAIRNASVQAVQSLMNLQI